MHYQFVAKPSDEAVALEAACLLGRLVGRSGRHHPEVHLMSLLYVWPDGPRVWRVLFRDEDVPDDSYEVRFPSLAEILADPYGADVAVKGFKPDVAGELPEGHFRLRLVVDLATENTSLEANGLTFYRPPDDQGGTPEDSPNLACPTSSSAPHVQGMLPGFDGPGIRKETRTKQRTPIGGDHARPRRKDVAKGGGD